MTKLPHPFADQAPPHHFNMTNAESHDSEFLVCYVYKLK
jgi:hypothetical protein